MTAIAKSAKRHPAAKKCCGWEEPAIYRLKQRHTGTDTQVHTQTKTHQDMLRHTKTQTKTYKHCLLVINWTPNTFFG